MQTMTVLALTLPDLLTTGYKKRRMYENNINNESANSRTPIIELNSCNTVSFMKNPVKGGNPARFIIRIGRSVVWKKIGTEIAIYIKK